MRLGPASSSKSKREESHHYLSALQGCTFYYVIVGDQEGWVCDKYLDFK
jgi:hypothetical protein